jgi:hypothetical protein
VCVGMHAVVVYFSVCMCVIVEESRPTVMGYAIRRRRISKRMSNLSFYWNRLPFVLTISYRLNVDYLKCTDI